MSEKYDVIICGGGLAGLTLARQLNQNLPNLSVLVVDRMSRPLPDSTLKVGESSVEIGAHYFGEKLKLADYFADRHYYKCGLRYIFGDSSLPIEQRPEFGLTKFPEVHSYQIDRGRLENDLRDMNEADGVKLLEGARIRDIIINEDKDLDHEVVVQCDGEPYTLKSRWVVDATGRGRIIQRKKGLKRPREKNCSSAWFRYEGRIDINDLVPDAQQEWHDRVPEKNRYYSTNHLMGEGYWVWLIPLGAGNTSVGIVTAEDIHPYATYKTYSLAMKWLEKYEPRLAEFLKDEKPMDFLGLRNYSHSSSQVFSEHRWACVGEAGVFADPFYSPGSDLIGFANSITTQMIGLDFEDKLTAEKVSEYSSFVIGLCNSLTDNIQLGYPVFGKPVVSACKLIWDNTAAWSFLCPQMFNSIYLDEEKSMQVRKVTSTFFALTRKIQQLLLEWTKLSPGRLTFDFLDYLSIPYLYDLRLRNLKSGKPVDELVADAKINMEKVEELAQVLFMIAVEDTMPEHLEKVRSAGWLHAWRIGLNPEMWEEKGLFEPKSEPRDLEEIYSQVRGKFRLATEQPAISSDKQDKEMEVVS